MTMTMTQDGLHGDKMWRGAMRDGRGARRAPPRYTARTSPPSTSRLSPLMYDASSESRKATAFATSAGRPRASGGDRLPRGLVHRIAVDPAGEDVVHPDPDARVSLRVQLGEVPHRRAERRRHRELRPGFARGEARDVHEGALLLAQHHRRREPRHADDVQEEQVEAGAPLIVGEREQIPLRRVAGVVHHAVDPAELLHRDADDLAQVLVRRRRPPAPRRRRGPSPARSPRRSARGARDRSRGR